MSPILEKLQLLAHAGHWLVYVLYAVPVGIVIGSLAVSVVRQRREDNQSGEQ